MVIFPESKRKKNLSYSKVVSRDCVKSGYSSYMKTTIIFSFILQIFSSIIELNTLNTFINDLFFIIEKSDICNFADENTLYSCGADLKTVLENLKQDASKLLYWFKINSKKAIPEKFQFMILRKKSYQP